MSLSFPTNFHHPFLITGPGQELLNAIKVLESRTEEKPSTFFHSASLHKEVISKFKHLNRYVKDPVALLKRFLNNETKYLTPEDRVQDFLAGFGFIYSQSSTVGPAQISTRALSELRNQFAHLDEYVLGKGFANKAEDNQKALLDYEVSMAAAAAILEKIVLIYQKHNIEVTEKSLVYGYNPDVWIDDTGNLYSFWEKAVSIDNSLKKAWPPNIDLRLRGAEVFQKSRHVQWFYSGIEA